MKYFLVFLLLIYSLNSFSQRADFEYNNTYPYYYNIPIKSKKTFLLNFGYGVAPNTINSNIGIGYKNVMVNYNFLKYKPIKNEKILTLNYLIGDFNKDNFIMNIGIGETSIDNYIIFNLGGLYKVTGPIYGTVDFFQNINGENQLLIGGKFLIF